MAGPMDLRGRVVITDAATGPLNRIRAGLQGIANQSDRTSVAQNAVESSARQINKSVGAMAAGGAGAVGVMAVINRAEQFQKSVYGIGTAAISEYTNNVEDAVSGTSRAVVDIAKVQQVMAGAEKMALSMSTELGHTPSRLIGIAEVLAKAGFDSERLEAATKSVAILSSTDLDTPVSRMAEFADVLNTIYKPRDGEAWGEFFKRQMDIVRVAAGETRLSVGSMMEGLRPFSALYSMLGGNDIDSAALLMSGVKAGGEPTEIGHTLKSNAVRFLRMSQEGASRFSALGLKRSDYADLTSIDPMRATGTLERLIPYAGISGDFRKQLNAEFSKAIAGGFYDSDDFHNKIMGQIAARAGVDMKDELSREKFTDNYHNAVFASATVDMMKLFRDLIQKNATAGDLATIFEGRRIGYNVQIMKGLNKYGDEFVEKLRRATGVGIDATQDIYKTSSYGRLQRFNALLEGFMIKLASSAGFEMFLNKAANFFDTLGKLPEPLLDVATTAGVLVIALAPIAVAFSVITRAAGALVGVLSKAGGLSGIGAAAAGAAGAATGAVGGAAARLGLAAPALSPAAQAALAAGGGAATGWAARRAMLGRIPGVGMAGSVARVGAYMVPVLGQAMMARDLIKAAPTILKAGNIAGKLIPGLNAIFLAYSIYRGVQKGRETGSVVEGIKEGSGFNDLAELFGGTSAQAAPAGPPPRDVGQQDPTGLMPDENRMPWLSQSAAGPASELPSSGQSDAALSAAQQTVDRIRAMFSSIDLGAEGQRMMITFAQGIRAGGAEVEAAAADVALRAKQRVSLNTGPAMVGAR